jgi:hypothetical protein
MQDLIRPVTRGAQPRCTRRHLAGFFLIQCDSFDRATAIAARVPEADLGLVEVRPIMDLSAFET